MDADPLVLRWGIGYEASDELSGCFNQVSLLKRLSRMTGNCQVRFLGESGLATVQSYPIR